MAIKVIKEKTPKKLKCIVCEEMFLKEETIIKSQKRYCKVCLELKGEESALYKIGICCLNTYVNYIILISLQA